MKDAALSETLPGTWQLLSRIDITASGERRAEPSLGEDPIALLIYDRHGHFAAQFMRRDRSVDMPDGPSGARNNSRAQGGYDAYFGTYTVDEASKTLTLRIEASSFPNQVGGPEQKRTITSLTKDELKYSNAAPLTGGTIDVAMRRAEQPASTGRAQ